MITKILKTQRMNQNLQLCSGTSVRFHVRFFKLFVFQIQLVFTLFFWTVANPQIISSFSWHPSHESRMLVISTNSSIKDFKVIDRITLVCREYLIFVINYMIFFRIGRQSLKSFGRMERKYFSVLIQMIATTKTLMILLLLCENAQVRDTDLR